MHKIIGFILLFVAANVVAQTDTTFCKKATLVLETLESNHYQPKTIDDDFSTYIFKTFFKRIDPKRMLFAKSDIDAFGNLETKLDDFLLGKECGFIQELSKSYEKQLLAAQKSIAIVQGSKLDFSGKDHITYGSIKDESQFSKNRKTLQNRWTKKIRIEIIRDFLSLSNPSNFKKVKDQIKSKIIDENACYIQDKLNTVNGIQSYIETTFLDIICSYFDPHSNYFDPTDNDNFLNSIGTETNSIGVWFSKNSDGKIVVAGLQTGSTAWKEKEINAGDLVLSLSAKNTVLKTTCLSLLSLYDFINDEENTTIAINILTKNNTHKTVTLKKENLKIEQNAINTFILKGEYTIGYIALPSFYTNMDFGFGSANDIAKQLFKLNAVNIDGLILDLRDNGGGSMKQAIDLAGMFIDKGPLGIYRDANNNREIIKDFNRGTLFTKPMVILVNQGSASASEFIAAALRDHYRAIIVGSKTYGKGTIQSILPLKNEIGFIKITIDKMYGFRGNTHQASGISPDIEFPSLYVGIEDGESGNSNFIKNDTILKDVYFKMPRAIDYENIRAKSMVRMQQNSSIKSIKEINSRLLSYLSKERKLVLSVEGIKKDSDIFDAIFEKSDDLKMKHSTFEVLNLEDYKEILAYNKNKASLNSYMIKNIQTDHEIEETYQIISDYIKQLAN
ncbi:S41 family peptidase [uncultured Kordia sp.]|uniref:S41 family peptidase n=1 Tax=uncultured Kordia sp. TaxID=507699 RepID=UPI00260402C7|nr:S41 family peptidase [uncultured Kordia sp.]